MLHSSIKSLFGAVLLTILVAFQANAQDGAKLFKQNCAVCHASHTDQKVTGPGLKGVFDRVPKPADKWLHSWILNNEKVIKSGDAYAKKLYADNNNAAMTVFEGQLTDADVDAIIKFIKEPLPVVAAAPGAATGGAGAAADEDAGAGIDPLYLILGAIVLLGIMIGALRSVRSSLKNNIDRQHGEVASEEDEMTFWQEVRQWMGKNTRFVGVMCIISGLHRYERLLERLLQHWRLLRLAKPVRVTNLSNRLSSLTRFTPAIMKSLVNTATTLWKNPATPAFLP